MRVPLASPLLLALIGLAQPSFAAPTPGTPQAERPRVALVLSGGGARGLAHIGVLKVLEAARIPIDCVVGTSMGALVGGSYAAGRRAGELETMATHTDWEGLLNDKVSRPKQPMRLKREREATLSDVEVGLSDRGEILLPRSAVGTQKIDLLIREMAFNTDVDSFDRLALPFRAVAADLETGDMVVLSRGDLAEAMRASMAVPGIFVPVERTTRVLVDGGIARNLPVDVGRGVCGDVVIAVDVGSPLLTRDEVRDAWSISDQALRALMQRTVDEQVRQLGTRDILIRPELGARSASDFGNPASAIAAGEAAARKALDKLTRLQVDEVGYQRWLRDFESKRRQPPVIRQVDVEPTRFVNPDVLREVTKIPTGQPLDAAQLNTKIEALFGRGDFEQVYYDLHDGVDGKTLLIQPWEKRWGPSYLRFGLGLRTDFDDEATFALSGQYRRTWVNALGAEWRTTARVGDARSFDTEFYQPLALDSGFFASARLSMANDPLPIYFQDTRLATSRVRTRSMHFELGSEFGSWGEIRLGFENRLRDHFLTTQLPGQNAAHYRDVSLYGEAVYDQLDSLDFPRTGVYARGRFTKGLPSWGSSEPYTLGEFDLKTAYRWGAWSVLAAMQYHSANNAPADRTAVLGGLFKLSAYPTDSLRTTGHLFGRLQLSQDVARLAPVFGRAGFWGVSLEAARFRQEETLRLVNRDWAASATFFVGSDTRMGPAFFGVGISERGRGRIWLSINGNF